MTNDETVRWNEQLETLPAVDILRWAAEQFSPRIVFASGFGAEGCVLIDLIGRNRLPIDLITLDTGLLFPETYMLWRQLEQRYDLVIRGVEPQHTVAEQARHEGPELWRRHPDQCCELRKVQPLAEALSGFDAWITAIRRDQTSTRANAAVVGLDQRFGLIKVNPLVRWTREEVWKHLADHDVPFNPLHLQGYPSIGCVPCTSRVADDEDPRAGRWRGVEKTECGLHAAALPSPVRIHTKDEFSLSRKALR